MAIRPVINNMDTLGTKLLLVDVKPAYERLKKDNGQYERTDRITHYNYTIVCLERKFEKISIKVEEARPLFDTEKTEVPDNTLVQFENLEITPYVSNNWIQLSAKAEKCTILKEG
ncbi:hypothetical protein C883_3232 [Bacillus stratosphericus LAMA 585]|uniref:hypothetical protein n=1 Tax=Bacillus pumilus TaxID=1408 RepID=UPI0002BF1978|nr:hypothetical protein [Bacillus pumilus]EMI14834.1 hypothetical protein C883_3232 [Bacillus stratosphericus LAMA 585]MDM5319022.1 hypothetical protein [Bacillus pumilus]MDR4994337.1 hypothetical protein [Bacillus altitudinis]